MKITYEIKIYGIVQSVGFRPTVYSYAIKNNILGFVQNKGSFVYIVAEGQEEGILNFINDIYTNPPKNANITKIEKNIIENKNYSCFTIEESENEQGLINISPDIAICENCKREFNYKENKRYEYAFINCTDCGPRFSIINNIPYDRKYTTMNEFSMCGECESEYLNPSDRRYHAEPTCCCDCGPKLLFSEETNNPILKAKEYLEKGQLLGIKGIGGYHIACNPYDNNSVLTLRDRKNRYKKPLAIMVKNINVAKKLANISIYEENILLSKEAPIVLLNKSENYNLCEEVAPNTNKIGIMLPYAPIHLLLFKYLNIDALVMTSGNISDEPIAYKDEDAFKRLDNICDGFLYHNREIENRIDDSVVTCLNNKEYIIRRARGYVPKSFYYKTNNNLEVLACGALLKNTFCLSKDNNYYLSSHIGDLEEGIAFDYYLEQIELYKKIFKINPQIIVCDKHPDYINTKWAKEVGLPLIEVQHHKAHGISSMAQNNLNEAICVTYDGTGYGDDNTIWGGEIFGGSVNHLERLAHLKPFKISGVNVDEKISPYKCLIPYLNDSDNISDYNEYNLLKTLTEKNINTFETTSMGRFFDAVSSLVLGIKNISFEGEGPILLEQIADSSENSYYNYEIENNIINQFIIMEEIKKDLKNNISPNIISGKLHNTVAKFTFEMCEKISKDININNVCLSGGVFQNILLVNKLYKLFESSNMNLFLCHNIPTNDAGISFGQAVYCLNNKE